NRRKLRERVIKAAEAALAVQNYVSFAGRTAEIIVTADEAIRQRATRGPHERSDMRDHDLSVEGQRPDFAIAQSGLFATCSIRAIRYLLRQDLPDHARLIRAT